MPEWHEHPEFTEIDDWVLVEFDKQCSDSYIRHGYNASECAEDYIFGVELFIANQRDLLNNLEKKVEKLCQLNKQ